MKNQLQNSSRTHWPLALAALSLSLGLAACGPKAEDATVGQQVDNTVARAENKAAEVGADVKSATADARSSMSEAASNASDAVKDAAITATLKTKLATEPRLSALRINVDTEAGKVSLSGDAPDAAARDLATSLARDVDGVVAVDNKLTLEAGK